MAKAAWKKLIRGGEKKRMDSTWLVKCPSWMDNAHMTKPHGWSLCENELMQVGAGYFEPLIECPHCGRRFSLFDGMKEAFQSDDPFLIRHFEFGVEQAGRERIFVGSPKTITFARPFEKPPVVFITPMGKPIFAVPATVTNEQFKIVGATEGTDSVAGGYEVQWVAFGNINEAETPIWRRLISSAEAHQSRQDYRSEIVDLESAVETFVDDFLWRELRSKGFDEKTVNWVLKHGIDAKVSVWVAELTRGAENHPNLDIQGIWRKDLKELRDRAIHKGTEISSQQALNARAAAFSMIVRTEPEALVQFKIRLGKEVRKDHPNITFGSVVLSGSRPR